MQKLSNRRRTLETVRGHDFDFRKRFGQNFLIDESVLERIVEAAGVSREDAVIEIGPGIGTLTQYLAESAGSVTAIEIDHDLIPILEETLADYDNVRIINQDVLKVDLQALARECLGGKPSDAEAGADDSGAEAGLGKAGTAGADDRDMAAATAEKSCSKLKIVANLPYYITTPIIMGLFEKKVPAESITVMVQKEVADRMQASCGSRDYGALSLAVQYYSSVHVALEVGPECFMPRPKVDSAVIRMDILDEPAVKVSDETLLFNVIKAAFMQRRKTLVNSVGSAAAVPFGKDEVGKALDDLGQSRSIRGEAMSLKEYAQLVNCLKSQE